MKINSFILFILLTSCQSSPYKIVRGKYLGNWATTLWTIKIAPNNQFEMTSEGHFGYTSTSGNYFIRQDTLFLNLDTASAIARHTNHRKFLISDDKCLIDIDSRYDYCKVRKGKWWSIEKRNIYYPQLPVDSAKNRRVVEFMLQETINNLKSDSKLDSTIFLKEYFEISTQNGYRFKRFDENIQILNEEELAKNKIRNFIIVHDFVIGDSIASISIQIEKSNFYSNYTYLKFKKESDRWEVTYRSK